MQQNVRAVIIGPILAFCLTALILTSALLAPSALQAQETQTAVLITNEKLQSFLADPGNLIVQTGNQNFAFSIELANDDATRAKGLMFRTKLASNAGMLFDFGESRAIYMWMKNTYVSLDMLFVRSDGTIHHLVKSTTPLSQSIIGSGGPVRYVLEVKKGTVDRTGVKPGDRLLHQLFTPKSSK